ncbi:MAG: methyltransferase domain-containing protein [Planctomycetales bacterium]|nr:methyltransferase domain-containing protein [Planctomycetales bacterium]
MTSTERLVLPEFPRSNTYHPDWVQENASGGANCLWLVEWLASALDLKPGMRVLDLGCGRASTSIFLAREFELFVWATDLWFSPSENLQRIRAADVERSVFPIHSDARQLPYANEFFDAIVSIDAFPYFGTDDHYLSYLARFVKPGGIIAIAGAGFIEEIEGNAPVHLKDWLDAEPSMWCMHSPAWWRMHWQRTGLVDVELADTMKDGWQRWLKWHRTVAPDNLVEIQAVESDAGRNMGYYRVVSRRRESTVLHEPILSVPTHYVYQPLLRSQS